VSPRFFAVSVAAAIGLALTACRSAEVGVSGERPSVLLILVDALRPDHLGCYGYERATSPALDALAAESVLFENAAAVSSWTKPSVPSLFTSLYPAQHGVYEGSAHGPEEALESDILPEQATTLAEAFAGCGYSTAAFIHNAQLRGRFGFRQGFELYEEDPRDAGEMVDRLLSWLRERRGADAQPFFAYLHLLDVHWPYEPPAGMARALGLPESASRDDRGLLDAVNDGLATLSPVQRDDLVARYDAEIRGVDEALGTLREGLEALGLAEEIVLIVTSDHGEAFLEHGTLGHGRGLYEEMLRIPLLLRLPGSRHAGTRVAARVTNLDVMPTLLEAAGCGPGGSARLEGRSLLDVARGRGSRPHDGTFAELRHGRTSRHAVWDDGWKLIRTARRTAAKPNPGGPGPDGGVLIGRRFEVEGIRLEGGRFLASGLEEESADDADDEITATLEAVDLITGRAQVLGFSVDLERASAQGPDRQPLELAALRPGRRVKIEGRATGPTEFLAKKVRLLEGDPEVEIEGIVRDVTDPRPDGLDLRIAGLLVTVRSKDLRQATGGGAGASAGATPQLPPTAAGPSQEREAPAESEIELYHLETDPAEKVNLADREPERVRALLAKLEAWEAEISARALPRAARTVVDPETARQLKALGYVR